MIRREFLGASLGSLFCARAAFGESLPTRGLWRDEVGPFAIGRFPEFGPGLFAFDYALPRSGPIRPAASGGWEVRGSLDGKAPVVHAAKLANSHLLVDDRSLRPVPITRVNFTVQSRSVRLSCELADCAGRRSRGTVLLIYGSGPATKEAFDLWAFWFLAAGFSVITHDKRGSGRSTGDWRTTSLESLGEDARRILDHAKAAGARAPYFAWGASQGGWIEPQLGAAGAVDGIIMHAGSATTPRAQILSAVRAELLAYEFPEAEIERALAYYALDTDVSLGARPWADIDAAYRDASRAGAEWLLAPPASRDAAERTTIRLMADFDPTPYWRRSSAPVLAIFGGKDWIVPAVDNLSRLEEIIAPDARLVTKLLPTANHLMFVAKTGVRTEYPTLSMMEPGYFSAMAGWLDACT